MSNLNDDLLLIPDPNGWIKNVEISLDGDHTHRLAICLFNNENVEMSVVVQSFNFFLDQDKFTDEHASLFENLARKLFMNMEEDFLVSSKALILVIHDDIVLARRVLGSVIDLPSEFGFPTVAAFATDRITWEDILLSRTGQVDMDVITSFQLNKIVDPSSAGQRFYPDGTENKEN